MKKGARLQEVRRDVFMWKAITVWDRLSKAAATKVLKTISGSFKRKHIVQTLNLDLYHAGGEEEEGPRVLHLKAKRYLGTRAHGPRG